MVAATIWWDRANESLVVDSQTEGTVEVARLHEYSNGSEIEGEAEVEQVRDFTLGDFEEALEEVARYFSTRPDIALMVWSDRGGEMPGLHTFILQRHGGVALGVSVQDPVFDDLSSASDMIRPLLSAHNCTVIEKTIHSAPDYGFHFLIRCPPSSCIGSLVSMARGAEALLTRASMKLSTPTGALSLVRSGALGALMGQPESQWLEVKQKSYGLENDRQKHELALDVAALANADLGGIILIGFSTKKDAAGQDAICATNGCSPGSLSAESYGEAIKHRVVPPVEGLVIEVVARDDRNYMAIYVPPQPHYVQPFLVKGGVIEGTKVSGAAFTVPHRVGSSKWSMSAEAIHALLVAARAALSHPNRGTTDIR